VYGAEDGWAAAQAASRIKPVWTLRKFIAKRPSTLTQAKWTNYSLYVITVIEITVTEFWLWPIPGMV
jgi:hypothetical protein